MACIETASPNGKQDEKRSYLLYIDEIARYFDVSPTDLLRGEEDKGTMKLSQNEEKLIQMYRYLHPESKEKLMATAEVLVNLGRSNTKIIRKKRVGNDESSKTYSHRGEVRMSGLVSVIIPAYNREETIKRAVESVLSQTYKNIEVIVVDDCSKDNTKNVVKGIKDDRVKLVELKENGGACIARNKGIEVSLGEYIAFQDSDDEWLPSKISRQIDFLKKTNADVVFCNFVKIDQHNVNCGEQPVGIPEGMTEFSALITKSIVSTQCIFAKRKCFDGIRFDPQMPRLQDWDIILSLSKYYKVYHLDEALVKMYVQSDSISTNYQKGITALSILWRKYESYLDSHPRIKRQWYIYLGNYKLADHQNPSREYQEALRITRTKDVFIKYLLARLGLIDLVYKASGRIE